MRQALVLCDRDGTLNIDRPGYVLSPDRLELYPEAAEALERLSRAGCRLAVVTNQSPVGRGLLSRQELDRIHDRLRSELSARGVSLLGIYYCPHAPDAGCGCRKPEAGLLRRAMVDLQGERGRTYMVGDSPSDVLAGRRAGALTVLVRWTGGPLPDPAPDYACGSLTEAADWIIRREELEAAGRAFGEVAAAAAVEEGSPVSQAHLGSVAKALEAFGAQKISEMARIIDEAGSRGRTVFVAGNGGSAATAAHFVVDLRKGGRRAGRMRIRALCLTDNVPSLTAWANDEGYPGALAEQLTDWAEPGDVFVAISVSGTSPNVVKAAEAALSAGCRVIALTGNPGSTLARLSELSLDFPGLSVEAVEDCHSAVCHAVTVSIREFGPASA